MTELTEKNVAVFVDSTVARQDPNEPLATWGFIMFLLDADGFRDMRPQAYKQVVGTSYASNQVDGQLEAIKTALSSFNCRSNAVSIYTNNMYVREMFTGIYMPKRKAELYLEVRELMSKQKVSFLEPDAIIGSAYPRRIQRLMSDHCNQKV